MSSSCNIVVHWNTYNSEMLPKGGIDLLSGKPRSPAKVQLTMHSPLAVSSHSQSTGHGEHLESSLLSSAEVDPKVKWQKLQRINTRRNRAHSPLLLYPWRPDLIELLSHLWRVRKDLLKTVTHVVDMTSGHRLPGPGLIPESSVMWALMLGWGVAVLVVATLCIPHG